MTAEAHADFIKKRRLHSRLYKKSRNSQWKRNEYTVFGNEQSFFGLPHVNGPKPNPVWGRFVMVFVLWDLPLCYLLNRFLKK